MDVSTIENQQQQVPYVSGKPLTGLIRQVDESGNTLNSWRIYDSRCFIGASGDNQVSIRDGELLTTHAAVIFGKNRFLVRAIDGSVRVAGRSIRENLFDEPTLIECGSCRLVVIPGKFTSPSALNQHWVTAGSMVDQASRLKVGPSVASDPGRQTSAILGKASSSNPVNLQSTPSPTPVTPPLPNLRVEDLTAALEPIQKAVERTNEGISSLRERVAGLETKQDQLASKSNNLEIPVVVDLVEKRISDLSEQYQAAFDTLSTSFDQRLDHLGQLLERFEERPVTESHVSNLDVTMQGQTPCADGNGIEVNDPQNVFEIPHPSSSPFVIESPREDASPFGPTEELYESQEYMPFTPSMESEPESVAIEPSHWQVEASKQSNPYTLPRYDEESVQQDMLADEAPTGANDDDFPPYPVSVSEHKHQLPSWFTEGESDSTSASATPSIDEDRKELYHVFRDSNIALVNDSLALDRPAEAQEDDAEPSPIELAEGLREPVVSVPSEWASARLNPIYAEDTSKWLNEVVESEELPRNQDIEDDASGDHASMSDAWFNPSPTATEVVDDGFSQQFLPTSELKSEFDEHSNPYQRGSDGEFSESSDSCETEQHYTWSDSHPTDSASDEPSFPKYEIEDRIEEELVLSTSKTERDESPEDVSDETADESIEDYMARLLARVKGGPDTESKTAKPSPRLVQPEKPRFPPPTLPAREGLRDEDAESIDDQEHHNPGPGVVLNTMDLQPLVRPNRAIGERFEDRAALRELANQTARSAIHKSSKKKLEIGVWGKLSISLMGLVGGIILLFLNGLNANIAMVGMVCSFVVCVLWGYEASVQAKLLFRSNEKSAKETRV